MSVIHEMKIDELEEEIDQLKAENEMNLSISTHLINTYRKDEEKLKAELLQKVESSNKVVVENEKLREGLKEFTKEVNGYDQCKMLSDIKPLAIKHGGFQNAYTISNILSGIEKAREILKEIDKDK